jgi:hypothetical protein
MSMTRNNLYSIIFLACLAGYIWLYLSISNTITKFGSAEICLFKNTTNIPCPSCGTTRSIISLTKGNLNEAFNSNPIGYLVAIIMLVAPLWILADIAMKTNTLLESYHKIETYLKRPKFAIPLIMIVLINWIWNITKGL